MSVAWSFCQFACNLCVGMGKLAMYVRRHIDVRISRNTIITALLHGLDGSHIRLILEAHN